MICHIPKLHEVPSGEWKCCECSVAGKEKSSRCGECEACVRSDDCGHCIPCLSKKKFGGNGKSHNTCRLRRCLLMRYAGPEKMSNIIPHQRKTLQLNKCSSRKRPVKAKHAHPEGGAKKSAKKKKRCGKFTSMNSTPASDEVKTLKENKKTKNMSKQILDCPSQYDTHPNCAKLIPCTKKRAKSLEQSRHGTREKRRKAMHSEKKGLVATRSNISILTKKDSARCCDGKDLVQCESFLKSQLMSGHINSASFQMVEGLNSPHITIVGSEQPVSECDDESSLHSNEL